MKCVKFCRLNKLIIKVVVEKKIINKIIKIGIKVLYVYFILVKNMLCKFK